MATTMEFDDMKAAWQTLDRRLEQQHALNLRLFRDSRSDKARSELRPLFWGQVSQIALGLAMILLGVSAWNRVDPPTHLLVSGIIVHVYGVLAIALAGITLGMLGRLDYSEPVLAIQRRLAWLRSFYIGAGMIVGLSWWLFWIPFAVVFFAWLSGGDFYVRVPLLLAVWVPVGLAGLVATWMFHRWALRSGRPRLVRAMHEAMAGGSLVRAQAALEEIRRFENE